EILKVMRYHSLVLDAHHVPEHFIVTGLSADDNEIMAIQHESLPIFGLQFHPESIGTPQGNQMIENFIEIVHNNKIIDR
ncbi:glutamine amidotransferase-related protein, partial [Leuconostoc pseudomesenteroides]